MNVDVVDGTTAKAIFATLTLTADPNCTILNKLQTMTYFAVGCYTRATGTLPDVVFQSITFSTRAMTSLSLSGDSSIHFANDALPYPYTATANFNDQTTENVTTMATVNSSIDTMASTTGTALGTTHTS